MMHARESFTGGLSVLMAVYGGDDHRLFRRAIDSIYQNSVWPDQTILVVDGPVPEQIDEVVREAVRSYRLHVVRLQCNQGLAGALNEGLKHVQTEWVARADADDFNLADRFLHQSRLIAAHPDMDLIGGAIEEVEQDVGTLAHRHVPLSAQGIRGWIPRRNPFNHMTVVARTSAIRAAGGYPALHLKEDYGLWARMIAAGSPCMNTDAILVRVTAGRKMLARRGGMAYVKSEYFLQKELVRLGISSIPAAIANGMARSMIFLMPPALKAQFYLRFLRTAPKPGGLA
jgi:glycosyltransferase involved in cell wall biosynthesis